MSRTDDRPPCRCGEPMMAGVHMTHDNPHGHRYRPVGQRFAGWRVTSARTYRQGTTYGTNISNGAGGTVSVKHRTGKGEPYVCLTCLKNACTHIDFIRSVEDAATQNV